MIKGSKKARRDQEVEAWLGLMGRSKVSGMVQKHNQNTYKKKEYKELYRVLAVKQKRKVV